MNARGEKILKREKFLKIRLHEMSKEESICVNAEIPE